MHEISVTANQLYLYYESFCGFVDHDQVLAELDCFRYFQLEKTAISFEDGYEKAHL